MIIDEQADFRALLMHHVTTSWPDAIITAYDPVSAGHLPDEFSGAGNDLILLGSRHGEDREGVDVLRRFMRRDNFPPVVYFGTREDREEAHALGPDAQFDRRRIDHGTLVESLRKVLVSRQRVASASSLLGGDVRTGMYPLVKGYRFIRKLGSTEHSGVYLAERESTRFRVVLKVLRQVPGHGVTVGAFDRFLHEYETIADIVHPHVVRIYDLGVADDHAHIAMEYLGGGDLRARIEKGIAERQGVQYLKQIASGLSAVHEMGVLHRDLKPGNIMLRLDGSLALIDFGLAKKAKLESEITDKGEIFGTPYYMSPEQGHGGAVDARSDIYSLGVIFFEMLTGKKPFRADTAMGVIFKHANSPVPALPGRLGAYQALLDRMLAKDPADRPQSAREIEKWL